MSANDEEISDENSTDTKTSKNKAASTTGKGRTKTRITATDGNHRPRRATDMSATARDEGAGLKSPAGRISIATPHARADGAIRAVDFGDLMEMALDRIDEPGGLGWDRAQRILRHAGAMEAWDKADEALEANDSTIKLTEEEAEALTNAIYEIVTDEERDDFDNPHPEAPQAAAGGQGEARASEGPDGEGRQAKGQEEAQPEDDDWTSPPRGKSKEVQFDDADVTSSASAFLLSTVAKPALVHHHADLFIELAASSPDRDHAINKAKWFSPFDVEGMAKQAIAWLREGRNVYVAQAFRRPTDPGPEQEIHIRATKKHVAGGYFVWADADTPQQVAALREVLNRFDIKPSVVVTTGTVPHQRIQAFIETNRWMEPAEIEAINAALSVAGETSTDKVADCNRVMRLGGSISFPSEAKAARSYIQEMTTFKAATPADLVRYDPGDLLRRLRGATADGSRDERQERRKGPRQDQHHDRRPGESQKDYTPSVFLRNVLDFAVEQGTRTVSPLNLTTPRATYGEIKAYLKAHVRDGYWHNPLLSATAVLAARGYERDEILTLVGPFGQKGGENDPQIIELVDSAVAKFAGRRVEGDGDEEGQDADAREWQDAQRQQREEERARKADDPRSSLVRPAIFKWQDPTTLPRYDFLYGTFLARGYLSITGSPGGRGKSTLLIAEALDMASGGKVFGVARRKVRVWLWNGEDSLVDINKRIAAAMIHFKITPEDVDGYLFVNSGKQRGSEIIIASEERAGLAMNRPVTSHLRQVISEHRIDVAVFDPFISTHAVSENANSLIDKVAKELSAIASDSNCAISVVHHVRKQGAGVDADITIDDLRGASSLVDACRGARVINVAKAGQGGMFLPPDEVKDFTPRSFIRVDGGKNSFAPVDEEGLWFRLIGVPLGNATGALGFDKGDFVGVATPAKVRGAMEDVKVAHLSAVQALLMREGDRASNSQAVDWLGYDIAGVMGIDIPEKDGDQKAAGARKSVVDRISKIIKVWIASGALEEFIVENRAKGRGQKRIRCGKID